MCSHHIAWIGILITKCLINATSIINSNRATAQLAGEALYKSCAVIVICEVMVIVYACV